METMQKRNLATTTVSEANGRIRFRMRQGARIIVAAMSILVVVASIFCWGRSYVVGDRSYTSYAPPAQHWLDIGAIEWREARGYAMFCWHDATITPNDAATMARFQPFFLGRASSDVERIVMRLDVLKWDFESRRHFGFGVDRRDVERYFDDQGNFAMRATALRAPLWFPTLLGLLTAFLSLRALRRDRYAFSPTRCRNCGYDLRAGHDKCPECGGESHVKVGDSDSTNTPSAPAGQQ